jgi:hypothetical protein
MTEQERQAIEHSMNEVLKFSFAFVLERSTRALR